VQILREIRDFIGIFIPSEFLIRQDLPDAAK